MDEVTYETAVYRAKHWGNEHGFFSVGGGWIYDNVNPGKSFCHGWSVLYDRRRRTIETWRRARGLKNAIGEPLKPSLSVAHVQAYSDKGYWNTVQQIFQLDRQGIHVGSTNQRDQKCYVIGIAWERSYRAGSTRLIYSSYEERIRAFRQAIKDAAEIDHDEIIEWRLVYAHEAKYVAECYPDAIKIK